MIASDENYTLTRVSRNIARLEGFLTMNFDGKDFLQTPSGLFYTYALSEYMPTKSITSKIRYPETQILIGNLFGKSSHGIIISSCGQYQLTSNNKGTWAVRYSQLVEVW